MCDQNLENKFDPIPFLSQFDFYSRLSEIRGISLVTFTAEACGSCRYLRHVLQQVQRNRPEWHLFEIDAGRDQALSHEFDVFHLPSMFLFFNGAYHCALHAEARIPAIIDAVHHALSLPAQEAP